MADELELKLARRDGKTGTNISTNRENHGDEKVPRKDISIASLVLHMEEGCALLREPEAADHYFIKVNGVLEPRYGAKIDPIKLTDTFEENEVRFFVGLVLKQITLPQSRIKNVVMIPSTGGVWQTKLLVQYHPESGDGVEELNNWLDQEVKIEIDFGQVEEAEADSQHQLGFNGDDQPEGMAAAGYQTGEKRSRARPGEGKRKRPSRAKSAIAERDGASQSTH